MKVKKTLSLLLAIGCLSALAVPASATEMRASAQIAAYDMEVTPASNQLAIYFSMIGTGKMDKLGCESILVYKLVGSEWTLTEIKTENYTGMSSSNAYTHTNTVYCSSTSGTRYKVTVTLFSENADGRDTRSETFYVTGK